MNKKIVLGLFIVVTGTVVLATTGFLVLRKQSTPVLPPPTPAATTTQQVVTPPSAATTTQPTPPPPSTPPLPECTISTGDVSTSTWKTFADPQWEITFQYPSTFQLSETGGAFVNVAGENSYNLYLKKDYHGPILEEGLGYVPSSCSRTIAGQDIEVIVDPYAPVSSTRPDLAVTTHIFGLSSKTHDYSFIIEGPASSSRRITDEIINTIEFVK
jgi:hypothetical protein